MLLVATDARFAGHDSGPGHPERPARLQAVEAGLATLDREACRTLEPRRATAAELVRVHTPEYVDRLEAFCAAGGGRLDADTAVTNASWEASLLAAGAGLEAADALRRGDGTAAFCAVRPPGHHAVADRAMGFCLFNSIAVTAAALRDRGDRVLIVDWDAHHGNGTEAMFWTDADVLYVSLHQWPFYPGTGDLHDVGAGAGAGTTVNVPLPGGATGDVFLQAIDDVIGPVAERFAPDWLLISAGFDAHRDDPLTDLGLRAGDYADLTARLTGLVPAGRTIVFLEGGYDLDALRTSVAATVSTLLGDPVRSEPASGGGPGATTVRAARDLHLPG